MTDDLDIQDRLRVWAATGLNASLSPEICQVLADRIELGEKSFQLGIQHLKRAQRHVLMSVAILATSLVIALGALLT